MFEQVIDQFYAEFRGGIAKNQVSDQRISRPLPRHQLCEVRIIKIKNTPSTIAEYRPLGKFNIMYLFGMGWTKCLINLDNDELYPYEFKIISQGDVEVPFRLYNITVDTGDTYEPNEEWSSLQIRFDQLKMKYDQALEQLASAKQELHDENFEDRKKKSQIEDAEQMKQIREKMYPQSTGFGFGGMV